MASKRNRFSKALIQNLNKDDIVEIFGMKYKFNGKKLIIMCECGNAYPSFSLPNEDNRKWCAKCPNKPKEAIDKIKKLCPCGITPLFNLPGQNGGLWCAKCPNKPFI